MDFKDNFSVPGKKVAVYLCLLMDLVHCPNSGMFITEEFAMFKRKENSNNNNKKTNNDKKILKSTKQSEDILSR